jgi:hypothetical protein
MNAASTGNPQKIHFVYFTCARHWQYFNCSFRSLLKLRYKRLGEIYIYVDRDDFLSTEQIKTLKAFCPAISIIKSRKITGWGAQTIANETQYFADISECIHPESFIAKTDSDVIFRSHMAFVKVFELSADLAGLANDRHSPLIYPIGGCYFIKCRIARHLLNYHPIDIFQQTLSLINNPLSQKRNSETLTVCPEDAVIYAIVKRMGGTIAYIPEFSRSIMHFSGQKEEMLKYDQRLYWLFRYHWKPFIGRLFPNRLRKAFKHAMTGSRHE